MKRRGFTLPELLTVIALIGVLAGVTWPSLNKLRNKQRLRGQAERIADLMRAAQEQTLAEQNIYGVFLDPTLEQAKLVTYGESYDGADDPDFAVLESIILEGALIDETAIHDTDSDSAIVRYTRVGTPSTIGITTITNASSDPTSTWNVEVTPAGAVKVYQ